MEHIQVKTNGGVSHKDKPRIYFSCHGADFDELFPVVSHYLMTSSDCAIYYYQGEPVLDDLFFSDLQRMHLFVIPVTSRLLTTANRTMDTELPYFLKHNVPVLPFLMEQGLDEMYAQRFGALHYLNPKDPDTTALRFEDKLKSYLENALFDNEMIQRVRAEFDASIFLSYRKCDRIHAQDLMHRIHQIPQCRDVSFWYDEFLTAGRDYNLEIESSIADCDVFVLVMTPRMLIPGNYVLTDELPAAMTLRAKQRVEILAVEMEKVDANKLHTSGFDIVSLQDLNNCGSDSIGLLDPNNKECFSNCFVRVLGPKNLGRKCGSEHDFLIGTAYLYGIDMEVDPKRGLGLILRSANAGNTEAMEKLADIYATGIGAERDLPQAVFWREKLVTLSKQAYENCLSEQNAKLYLYHCSKLFELFSLSLDYKNLVRLQKQIAPVLEYWMKRSDHDWYLKYQLGLYEVLAYLSNLNTPLASGRWFTKAQKLWRKLNRVNGVPDAGDMLEQYLIKANRCLGRYSASDNTILTYFVPDFWKHIQLSRAQYYQYKAYRILLDLNEEYEGYHHQKLSKIMDDIANVWGKLDILTLAKHWYNRALQIRLRYKDDPNPAVAEDLAGSYLNMGSTCCGQIRKIRYRFFSSFFLGFWEPQLVKEARAWLDKASQLQSELLRKNDTPSARIQWIMIQYHRSVVDLDIPLMERAYDSMRELAERHPEIDRLRMLESALKQELKSFRKTKHRPIP